MATKKASRKKKNGKLTGAAKAAFVKRMAAGRKKHSGGLKRVKKTNGSGMDGRISKLWLAGMSKARIVKHLGVTSRNVDEVVRGFGKLLGKSAKKPLKRAKKNPAKTGVRRKGNPSESDLANFYRETHGRDPDKIVDVRETIREHSKLMGVGKLDAMTIKSDVSGETVELNEFRGALLCSNGTGTQLFIKGGDQSVDLDAFDIEVEHEMQTLGELTVIDYETTKDHLGDEGGHAIFHHRFDRPRPIVTYDVRNRLLTISGGVYVLQGRGVVD